MAKSQDCSFLPSRILTRGRILVLVLGLLALTANSMADVTFNGTTFTGEGTYDQAAGTADAPLTTNLVVTGSEDSSKIILSGGFYTTGYFRHSKGVLEIAEGTSNTCKDFGVQKGGANGTTAYIKGTLHVTGLFMGNYTKSCTSHIYISGNVTVDGSFYSSNANSAQNIINQTDGVVNFLTSNDLAIRIAHYPTAAKYPCRYNLSGGTFNVPNTTTYVGWNGPGELNISGGTANLKGIQLVGGYNGTTGDYANGKGTINLTGGRLNIGDGGVTLKNERHEINLGNGTIGALASHSWADTLTVTLTSGKTPTFDIDADKTITINSKVTGSGNLKKIGAGTLTLSGSNNYSGTTTITSGTLTASKIGSIGTGALTLSNATLSAPQGTVPASSVTITGDSTFISTSGWNLFKNFSGAGTLTLTGSGYLALTGGASSTYTGANYTGDYIIGTSSKEGKLAIEANDSINPGSSINIVNGTLSFSHTDNISCSNVISGTGTVEKANTGTLTLTGANTYTGTTTVSGGVLELTDDAVVANGPVTVGANGTLEYNLSSGKKQLLTIYYDSEASNNKISSAGRVVKTGDGTLQICTSVAGQVDASSFVVSSGRLDMKEYFKGSLTVEAGATLSPGNSIGKLTVDGTFSLDSGATLLMEVGKNDQGEIAVDQLILSEVNEETFASGSIINIVLDPDSGLQGGDSFTDLVFITTTSDADAASIYDAVKNATFSYYFPGYEVKLDGKNILLSGTLDSNAVPEPSTWALLILGAAGLLYVRKRKN